MKLKVIAKNMIPKIEQEDIEKVEYSFGNLCIYIIATDLLNPDEYVRIKLDCGKVWHYRVGDEGFYLNWENDFPIPGTPEREEYLKNYVFEFFETDYLEWFRHSISGTLDDDWLRHFCIATRNDIVDVIAKNEPIITIESINKDKYLKS